MDSRQGRSGLYRDERMGRRAASTWVVGSLVGAFGLCAVAWFLFISGVWSVNSVEFEGLTGVSREEVASTTFMLIDKGPWKPWDKKNIFFIDETWLAQQLKEYYFAEEVVVEKDYPNVLRHKFRERQRSVVLVSKGQFLLVDTQGLVAGEAQDAALASAKNRLQGKTLSTLNDLPLVISDLNEPAALGYQAAESETVKNWIEAYKALYESGMKFRYLELKAIEDRTIHLITDQGYEVLLDRQTPLDTQIETYQKYIETKPKNVKISEYIDVRVPGKVFYK
jgi:cell division septal protein FtsQ